MRALRPFVLCLLVTAFATGFGKPANNIDTPVTSVVLGDAVNPDATVPNRRIVSDPNGAYLHGVSGVKSVIQPVGDWELDLSGSSFRRVVLDFRHSAGGSAPFTLVTTPARLISKCASLHPGGYRALTSAGASQICPLAVSFTESSENYRVTFNQNNFSSTGWAMVTCTAADANGCTAWRIASVDTNPNNGELTTVGKLQKLTTVRGKTTTQDLGDFYMGFEFEVSK